MAMLDEGIRSDSSSRIDAVLRDLDMPPDEVDAVVAADQPVIVHRYLELHRERLQERLADQVRMLEHLEGVLSQELLEAPPRPRGSCPSSKDGRPLRDWAVDPATEGRR